MSMHPSTPELSPSTPVPAEDAVLTAADLAALRHALVHCREQRTAQLATMSLGPVDVADPVARAHATAVRETLAAIDAALARLDVGTYGRCRHCGRSVPLERLQLVPYADACVGCLRLQPQGR